MKLTEFATQINAIKFKMQEIAKFETKCDTSERRHYSKLFPLLSDLAKKHNAGKEWVDKNTGYAKHYIAENGTVERHLFVQDAIELVGRENFYHWSEVIGREQEAFDDPDLKSVKREMLREFLKTHATVLDKRLVAHFKHPVREDWRSWKGSYTFNESLRAETEKLIKENLLSFTTDELRRLPSLVKDPAAVRSIFAFAIERLPVGILVDDGIADIGLALCSSIAGTPTQNIFTNIRKNSKTRGDASDNYRAVMHITEISKNSRVQSNGANLYLSRVLRYVYTEDIYAISDFIVGLLATKADRSIITSAILANKFYTEEQKQKITLITN